MKNLLFTIFSLFIMSYSFSATIIQVRPDDEKKMEELNTLMPHDVNDLPTMNCNIFDSEITYLRWHIPGVDPMASDRDKQQRITSLDAQVNEFSLLKACGYVQHLCFAVPEGLFIKKVDELNYEDGKKWSKSAYKLDMERFLTRYERKLHEWFPNLTIYITIYQW